MTIGVVLVTYNASEIILDCLESLLASQDADLRVVVVDNASKDDTVAVIENWSRNPTSWKASQNDVFNPKPHGPIRLVQGVPRAGLSEIALVRSEVNTGFAGGVNIGLRLLREDADVDYFWVLNPDCVAENATASRLENQAREAGRFGVIGGRVFLKSPPLSIQADGGRINFMTGICIPHNLFKIGRDHPAPTTENLDYISGAHMLVSRDFLEKAGLMPEDYFLYYEEIDWCCRRGDLPLLLNPEAVVHHDGGHSIGSASVNQGPSAMAAYFTGRSRMKFIRRYRPVALPIAYAYSFGKSLKFLLKGQATAGFAMLRGISGIAPPEQVRRVLKP